MTVRVDDEDVLDKILTVERTIFPNLPDSYIRQLRNPEEEFGLAVFQEAFRQLIEQGTERTEITRVSTASGTTIYGYQGHTRYSVREAGEVCLSRRGVGESVVKAAQKIGFRVI